jgi:PAS domain S-box-containing protein
MTEPSQRLVVEDESIVRNLVENSLTGISIIQNNRFVYQNSEQKKLYDLYDASSEKTLLQDLKNVHPEDLVKVKAAYRRIMTDEVQSVETDFRFYPSGKVGNETDLKWIQCRATRFKYQGKDAIWLNVVDVTKTKPLEHQLIIRNKMLSLGK